MKAKELRQKIDINYPKAGWDHKLTPSETKEWQELVDDLKFLSEIRVPRFVQIKNENSREYHVFCDASERGIGTVIYSVSLNDSETKVTLLADKSKINPR